MIAAPLALALAADARVTAAPLALAADAAVTVAVDCAGVDADEVRRLLAIELRRPVISDGPPLARVECRDESATLVADNDGERRRTIALGETAPVARPRLLALSLAELMVPPPAAPPAVTASSPPSGPPAASRSPVLLVALGLARAWPAGFLSYGGDVRLSAPLARRFAWQIDVAFEHGAPPAEQGAVSLDAVSAGAALLAHVRAGTWWLAAGPAVRGGGYRLRGRPFDAAAFDGHTVSGLTGGPALMIAVAPPLVGRLAFELSLEAGYLVRPVVGYAGSNRAAAVEGAWIGGAFGAGLGY